MTKNVRTIAIVLASIVLVVGTYLAYEKYSRRHQVLSMLEDTSSRLREMLQAHAKEGVGVGMERHAAAAEAHVTLLRKMNTSSFRPLADAADDYLLTSREILRRAAAIESARVRVTVSLEALNTHMNANRGRADWVKEAVRLKEVLNAAARDYRIAVESFVSLLQTFPASQLKIAPYVEHEVLIDDATIERARQGTLDAFAATEQNIRPAGNTGGSH